MMIFRCWCCNAPLPDRASSLHARHLASDPPDAGPSPPQDAILISRSLIGGKQGEAVKTLPTFSACESTEVST